MGFFCRKLYKELTNELFVAKKQYPDLENEITRIYQNILNLLVQKFNFKERKFTILKSIATAVIFIRRLRKTFVAGMAQVKLDLSLALKLIDKFEGNSLQLGKFFGNSRLTETLFTKRSRAGPINFH